MELGIHVYCAHVSNEAEYSVNSSKICDVHINYVLLLWMDDLILDFVPEQELSCLSNVICLHSDFDW